MRKILSYAKSHIYDIHAVIAATITLVLMYFIKRPIKHRIASYVNKRAETDLKWQENKAIYIRRCNIVLILLTMVIAYVMFWVLSLISPLIEFSAQSACMSGVFALVEYACIDQMSFVKWEE